MSTSNGPLTAEQTLWVAVLLAGPTALLGGLTAAREGVLRFAGGAGPIQVLVDGDRQYPELRRRLPLDMPAMMVRRTTVTPEEHHQVGRPMRTSMARSLVDAAEWARSDDEAQAIIAAGCQQRRVVPAEILAALRWLPRVRRRRLIAAAAADADGGATALSEIDFVRLCRRHRLPPPDLQQRRKDRAGRVRYLDACWRRRRPDPPFPGLSDPGAPGRNSRPLTAALRAAGWPG